MAKQAVKSLVGWPSVMVVTAPCKHLKLRRLGLLYLPFLKRAHSREMAVQEFCADLQDLLLAAGKAGHTWRKAVVRPKAYRPRGPGLAICDEEHANDSLVLVNVVRERK